MSKGGSSSKSSSTQTQTTTPTQATLGALGANLAGAQSLASTGFKPVTGSNIQGYLSPYLSSVADSTMAQLDNQNQQQISQNGVSQAAAGAYNSTRAGVQNALTNQLFGQTAASTLSNLYNTGYQQAEGTATTENTQQNNFPLALQALLNSATQTQAAAGGSTTSGSGTQNTNSTNYNIDLSKILSGTTGSPLGPLSFAV